MTIKIESDSIKHGSKIWFETDKKPFTVKSHNNRFTILTKPFNFQHTCLYTIIDWNRNKRNRNNMVFNPYDYMVQKDIDECMKDLLNGKVELSIRGILDLDIVRVEY